MRPTIISIHASRGGSDPMRRLFLMRMQDFNPRFPRGKRRCRSWKLRCRSLFQSTLPAGEATKMPKDTVLLLFISIHASRGGSDPEFLDKLTDLASISIHASRGGSDSTVKLSPDDRTSRHGFREPGFLRFRHRQISCLFLLGAWGSRL